MNGRLLVSIDIDGDSVPAGTAFIERRRNSTNTTFRYDDEYLARPTSYALDPALSMFEGPQSMNGLPGAFQDCSPDRWGRNLIAKWIRSQAVLQGRQAPSIGEVDYLVRVSDVTRQGALRYRVSVDSPYLDPDPNVPKLIALPKLLRASEIVARDEGDDMAAIKALLDAGQVPWAEHAPRHPSSPTKDFSSRSSPITTTAGTSWDGRRRYSTLHSEQGYRRHGASWSPSEPSVRCC